MFDTIKERKRRLRKQYGNKLPIEILIIWNNLKEMNKLLKSG